MRCPSCDSPSLVSQVEFQSHQGAGVARSFNEGNVAMGVLKLMWIMISKYAVAEWTCRSCSQSFRSYEIASMKTILIYAVVAGLIGFFTGPMPGTSFLLFCLEVLLIVSVSKVNKQAIHIAEIGCLMVFIIMIVQGLKMLVVELLILVPFLGYGVQALIGFSFVLLLGMALDAYYTVKARRAIAAAEQSEAQ